MTKTIFRRNCLLKLLPVLFLAVSFHQRSLAQSYTVLSPNHSLVVTFNLEDGIPYYYIARNGAVVIGKSRLGLLLKNNPALADGFTIQAVDSESVDVTWTQPWGEVKDIRNNYHELAINLTKHADKPLKLKIVFRAFDYGVGLRYEVPEQEVLPNFEISDELTEFRLTSDMNAWWIPAYRGERYEYLYKSSPLSTIDTVHTPLTLQAEDGLCISIHEAALIDYAAMTLARRETSLLKADLVPWSDDIKVKTSTPMKSPWRTIEITDSPGELLTSYLSLNLNEPNKLADISWVEPGKYVGIWWELHLGKTTWGSGPRHGATTENTKKYIDFASKYGFKGVLVEGWNLGWDGDWIKNGDKFNFLKSYDDFDLTEVSRYAAEKHVRLIGHNETGGGVLNYEAQLPEAFALYHKLGIRAVKTGYVKLDPGINRIDEKGNLQKEWHHGQFMVRHYQKVVEEAAYNQIMINVHEPIKDTGIRRTYPNMMTREGARGQEYNAWSADGGNPPEHETILPFTRMLAGPMDFTPGIFGLLYKKERPKNRVNTTLAKQLSLYIVLYSPLHMAADLPENYENNLKPFQFIIDVPTDWQDTRVLNGVIGDYVTIVRKDRKSDDWYLGSLTDENGRNLSVQLDFLDPGQSYRAQIYRDAATADWEKNPYALEIAEQTVTQATKYEIRLAPGGGQAIRFIPILKK